MGTLRALEADVAVPSGLMRLDAHLFVPDRASAIVLFAHGSRSSRHSPRNLHVADRLHAAGLATLLMDLLTLREDEQPQRRFDIGILAARLADAVRYLAREASTAHLPVGLFGASTGAAAALRVASELPARIGAVVSRG